MTLLISSRDTSGVVHVRQMSGDFPGRQPLRVQRQDRLVEPIETAGVLRNDPRRERPGPVPRNLDAHRSDLGLDGLGSVTVADVRPPTGRLIDTGLVEVSTELGVQC